MILIRAVDWSKILIRLHKILLWFGRQILVNRWIGILNTNGKVMKNCTGHDYHLGSIYVDSHPKRQHRKPVLPGIETLRNGTACPDLGLVIEFFSLHYGFSKRCHHIFSKSVFTITQKVIASKLISFPSLLQSTVVENCAFLG